MRIAIVASFLAGLFLSAATVHADVSFEVVGDDKALRKALMGNSALAAIETVSAVAPQDLVATAQADYRKLAATLYERGYFGPVISITLDGREASNVSPFRQVARYDSVRISVDAGRKYQLGKVSIAPVVPGTDLPEGFVAGAEASTLILRKTAETAIDAWRGMGHPKAKIARQSIRANAAKAVLNADLQVAPGPQARFGQLMPQGQSRMRAERIDAIGGLPRNAQYHPDIVTRVAERLRDSGGFASVALTEGDVAADGMMDVTAVLVEAPLRRFGIGAELTSDEGLGLSGFWLHRNLFGGAERLRFDAEVTGIGGNSGGVDADFGVTYARPATLTPDTNLQIGARVTRLDEPTFLQESAELSFGFEHRFSKTKTGSVFAEIARSKITDNFSTRHVTLVSLPSTMVWDKRDDRLDARQGWYLATGAQPFLIYADSGGLRATVDARAYRALGASGKTRLAGRVQLGTVAGGSIGSLPPDWLFYSGGPDTVRGLSYQSLGALQGGVATGGRSFAGASFEMRHDITGPWGAAVFADAGMISAGAGWTGSSDWHAGVGIGARYNTPIGAIRVDVATPVRSPTASNNLAFYIGIGQSF
ncbi:autotransporter assembly complex family protein [Cognatishimia sp. WU-CL00825]|uniref:autotransporter assembly complex protein TamA n=1 Tax=Cognatishimia sp. WU-CL00825 TaxID=3127658 RepID=UPI003109805B